MKTFDFTKTQNLTKRLAMPIHFCFVIFLGIVSPGHSIAVNAAYL